MSNREQNMVFFLLIVLVAVVGFKFLVEPQMLAATANDSLYAQLQQEKEIVDLSSSQNSEYTENYEENLATLEELQENIGAYLEDEALDNRMTSLIKSKGLGVEVLSIDQTASNYTAEGLEAVTVKSVTMQVYGTTKEMLSFIQAFQESTDCIIVGMDMDTTEGTATSYSTTSGTTVQGTLTITVAVYMDAPVVEVEEEMTEDAAE